MANVGDTIGRYELVEKLGSGGMGEVFRAHDPQLHRSVALKVLLVAPSEGGTRARRVARMLREARAAAAFSHPNAVAIYDVGESDGLPFLVMEIVVGRTLRACQKDASVAWPRKIGWLAQAARALGAAHRAGLVHRDVKPDNVMVRDEDDTAKVLDFGIARAASDADTPPSARSGERRDVGDGDVAAGGGSGGSTLGTLTEKGSLVGTPRYMAPEQVRREAVDGRTDQFAWGVMAYELLSGKMPWPATEKYALVEGILDKEPIALRQVCPELPPEVTDVVHRALQKSPDDRFESMDEAADALSPFAPSRSLTVRPPAAGVSAATTASRRRRGTFVLAAFGLGVLGLLAATGTTIAKRLAGPRVSHCAQMIDSRTGRRCTIPLSEDEAAHFEDGRRFTTLGGHLVKMEIENEAMRHWSEADREDVVTYTYDRDRLVYAVARERHGRFLGRENYSADAARLTFTEEDGTTPRPINDSDAVEMRFEYDPNGYVSRERYFGRTGKPRPIGGVYGLERQSRADGNVIRETTLGADGEPAADASGTCATVYERDARGFRQKMSYFACDGTPATVAWVHARVADRDAYGNAIMYRYQNAVGQAAATAGSAGYANQVQRDSRGHASRITVLDARGKPRNGKGRALAAETRIYDDRGRQLEHRAFDLAGNPVMDQSGATTRLVWDDHDDVREESVFDTRDKPTVGIFGFASRKTDYDEGGRLVRTTYFDASGEVAPRREGYAVLEFAYDDRDLLTDKRYLDRDGHLVANSSGLAHERCEWSAFRQKLGCAFFGEDDRPVLADAGYASMKRTFDDDDNLVAVGYFDVGGAPAFYDGQYASQRFRYDDGGRRVETASYDANGNLVLLKDGYAIERTTRDRSGDATEVAYFGKHEEPIVRNGGYAQKRLEYDARRRNVVTALFDAKGAPVMGSDGWATERITYDERGAVVRTAHFDTADRPVLTRGGSAAVAKTYDDRGNVLTETRIGIDGAPLVMADGFAIRRSEYDGKDLLTEETLLGANHQPVVGKQGWATRQLSHDDAQNPVVEAFLDADHRPILAGGTPKGGGYAAVHSKFDLRRWLVESAYFDPSGIPMNGPDGVPVVRYERDVLGHATETRYLDGTGAPATSKDGRQVVKAKYDGGGRLIEELLFDAGGAPISPSVAPDGCAGHRTKYDERGRKVEEVCVDDKGAPGLSREGWAIRRTLHDARGNVVDESTYGADGKLLADKTGVAKRKSRYDERSLKLETAFFDAADKPVRDTRGVAVTRYRYDDTGKQVEESPLDETGAPVRLKDAAKGR